jgi:hypothetical protein
MGTAVVGVAMDGDDGCRGDGGRRRRSSGLKWMRAAGVMATVYGERARGGWIGGRGKWRLGFSS